ncbi:MAG TPA: ATP-binding protein [bacterium]
MTQDDSAAKEMNHQIFSSPKRIMLFLRFVLILATILIMTYSKRGLSIDSPGYVIALIYFASNVIFYFIPTKIINRPVSSFFVLLFDILIITLAIYLSEGIQTDFYLVYFLVIFISAIGQNIGGSFVIAIVISIFYGWLLYRENPGISLIDAKFLIRIPFLFIISFISSFWVSFVRRESRKKNELEKKNIELRHIIDKEIAKEIELRIYHERIINSVPSGIIVIKRDGVITTLNPEAERALGLKKDDTEGYNIKNVQELQPLWDKIEPSLHDGKAIGRDEIDICNRRGDPIPLGFSTSLIYRPEGSVTGCVVVFKDLSQVRALEEKLKQSERLSYLGKMASWVAHEIRNPLTAIAGFAQLLATTRDPASIDLYSGEIRNGADRINHIIDDILGFVRSKQLQMKDVDVRGLIEGIVKHFAADIRIKGISKPVVQGEYESLRRVFVNLLQNSLDAIGKEGKVEIEIAENDEWTIIKVSDNGQGIAEQDLKCLFTPFYTTKERGTGLGLAIVKKIIDEHNGKIEFTSIVGEGTTCNIMLRKGPAVLPRQ